VIAEALGRDREAEWVLAGSEDPVVEEHDAALAGRADVQLSLRDGRVVPAASVPAPAFSSAPALG